MTQAVDMIRELLLYRGFGQTLRCLEAEMAADRSNGGMQVRGRSTALAISGNAIRGAMFNSRSVAFVDVTKIGFDLNVNKGLETTCGH